MIDYHTIETATQVLKDKNVATFLRIKSINHDNSTLIVIDIDYGDYVADLKSLCKSTSFPLHKNRRHKLKITAFKNKFIGKTVKGLKILDAFYGPDRGYKNKSFYLEYENSCGHVSISTHVGITKYKESFICTACTMIVHGERSKVNGVRKKRTSTYTHWQRINNTLPVRYQHDFALFRLEVGERPGPRCDVQVVDGKLVWVSLNILEDKELNLIASAIRQAFRHSVIYKNAVSLSRVDTSEGVRYQCSNCKNLVRRKDIQVDHIDPIADVSGVPLTKNTLIDRIWTDRIQILDRSCHARKSSAENKERKLNKERLKNGK
jgi:hypothetical protein